MDNILNNSGKDGFIVLSRVVVWLGVSACLVIYMKAFIFKSAVYTCLVY
jgi:hypothetical protein